MAGCVLVTGLGGGFLLGTYQGQVDLRATDTLRIRGEIETQYRQALTDIEAGNYELAYERLWVVTRLNPAYADADEQFERVKWILENPPTPTPTITPLPTMEPGEVEPTPIVDAETLFVEAEAAYQASDWETTIERLDTLTGAAPDYRSDEVREMLLKALSTLGVQRIDAGRLEEGIILIDRAAVYGAVTQEAQSKRDLAAEYLRAVDFMGVNWARAIEELEALYFRVPEYRDVGRRLFLAYRGYADAFVAGGEYCPAVPWYQKALNLVYDAEVEAKQNEVQAQCANATPTPLPTSDPGLIPGAVGISVYNQANLRQGPSTQTAVLAEMSGGTPLGAIGRNPDTSWLFVVTSSGLRGWVSVEVVNIELKETEIAALPVTEEQGGEPPAQP